MSISALPQFPEETVDRLRVIEERSKPSSERPRLSLSLEADLAEVEEKTARCYAENENLVHRIRRLSKRIDESAVVHRIEIGNATTSPQRPSKLKG